MGRIVICDDNIVKGIRILLPCVNSLNTGNEVTMPVDPCIENCGHCDSHCYIGKD